MKLRSREQTTIISLVTAGLTAFFLVLVIQTVVVYDNFPASLFVLLMGMFFVFPFYRASRACAIVQADELTVRNVFSTKRISAREILRFRLGPARSSIFYGAAAVELRSGEELIIFGIQSPSPVVRPNDTNAQQLVDQLNEWLLEAQMRTASAHSEAR